MESKFLIVGLGNPGKKYKLSRHNLGFMVVDKMAAKFQCSFKRVSWQFWAAKIRYKDKSIILMKPATYMNLSGKAVYKGVKKYNTTLSNLLVLTDDLNLPFGKLRLRAKGSAGGHNGLKSIIEYLDTDQFPRLRIGIADKFSESDVVNFVLSSFEMQELKELDSIVERAVDCVLHFIDSGLKSSMDSFNKK